MFTFVTAISLAPALAFPASDHVKNSDTHTDVKVRALPRFVEFAIVSDMPAEDMADLLYQLFRSHPVLKDELPCYRYGTDKIQLGCTKTIREDVFHARFDMKRKTLIFSLDPRTLNVDYKPDYAQFDTLAMQVGQMLTARFGAEKVIVK